MSLSTQELVRYARHFSLPEVGIEGQKKLKAAKVIAVGGGGLANPVLLYLAAAGVGGLAVIDADVVDATNLQRQILFSESDVGKAKVDVIKAKLSALNSGITINTHAVELTANNAHELLRGYDIVVDCTDNFPTRYIVNDACWHLKIPNVFASISRFEGQCSVFCAGQGPCYRCLYAEPPPPGLVPNCAEGGVLGVLPGLLGTIQAAQVVNLILGIGEPLIGRILLVDALTSRFRELRLSQDENCLLCAKHTAYQDLPRPERSCQMSQANVPEISVQELQPLLERDQVTLIDVREPHEYEICNLSGKLIPLGALEEHINEIDQSKPIIVHCRSGGRSAQAVQILAEHDIAAKNLAGGILAWADKIDNSMPKY